MTNPDTSGMNVAAELAKLRGEMSTGFERIAGQLNLITEAQKNHTADIADLDRRVAALEARRWPLGPIAALAAVVSAVVAGVVYIAGL